MSLPQYMHQKEGYGKHAVEQKRFAMFVLPAFVRFLDGIKTSIFETFTVCDYGAADGKTSCQLMKACKDTLGFCHGRNMCWILNDLPGNNFNRIFKELKAEIDQVFPEDGTVFPMASAGSFYSQVIPKDFVHLGLCLTAVHWLSRSPVIGNELEMPAVYELARDISRADWEMFLLQRAKELKQGGRLFVTVRAVKEKLVSPHVCVTEAIRQLYDRDLITKDELELMVLPRVFNRTEEEIRVPFEAVGGHVASKAGLRLLKVDRHQHEYSFYKEWKDTGTINDPATTDYIIEWLLNHLKTFCHSYLSVLSETRDDQEQEMILQAFYQNAKDYLKANLDDFDMSPPYYAVQIEKI